MTGPSTLTRPPRYAPTSYHHGTRRARLTRRGLPVVIVLLVVSTLAGLSWQRLREHQISADRAFAPAALWPRSGQAAFAETGRPAAASPQQQPVPIASVAKVMTAYVVLRVLPLRPGESGPLLPVTTDDVAETAQRRGRGESVVPVAAGVDLTELQALQAILVPSANNVAVMLARFAAGSLDAFVAEMNARARVLKMRRTSYTDPSGYDSSTVSTAADQLSLFTVAMRNPVLAAIMGAATVRLPVAGLVHNTDTLLGQHGVVAGKTGSDDEAGGCFAFRAVRTVDGQPVTITAVVLGQRFGPPVPAVLAAATGFIERIVAGRAG